MLRLSSKVMDKKYLPKMVSVKKVGLTFVATKILTLTTARTTRYSLAPTRYSFRIYFIFVSQLCNNNNSSKLNLQLQLCFLWLLRFFRTKVIFRVLKIITFTNCLLSMQEIVTLRKNMSLVPYFYVSKNVLYLGTY